MQAQNSSEGKKSKKSRQDPAPPTRSEAGRLGIAKEFIDFLLAHDVSSLRSPTHASHWKESRRSAFAQRSKAIRWQP